MNDVDLMDLERAGAVAAQAGASADANPYLVPTNMPAATGGSLPEWSRMHDAWHDGFERARRSAPGPNPARKEQIRPTLLVTMVNRRLRWVPVIRVELERNPGAVLRVDRPTAHAVDGAGRGWDIADFECGALRAADCPEQFRTIVDRLRDEFDLR